jgi:hypothetical protein
MWDAARGEERIADTEFEASIANLETHFAFHHVEPFFLREMHVQSRARVGQEISVLNDEEVAARVGWDNFESKRAEPERVKMAGAIFAGWDGMEGRSSRRIGRALREDVLESQGGEQGRGRLEEAAAFDSHAEMIGENVFG